MEIPKDGSMNREEAEQWVDALLRSMEGNTPSTFKEALAAVGSECDRLMVQKNMRYGSKNVSLWGALGVAVRLTDKVMRLKTLLTNGNIDPGDESIRDTAKDVRNYGTILVMLLDGTWELPMVDGASGGAQAENAISDYPYPKPVCENFRDVGDGRHCKTCGNHYSKHDITGRVTPDTRIPRG